MRKITLEEVQTGDAASTPFYVVLVDGVSTDIGISCSEASRREAAVIGLAHGIDPVELILGALEVEFKNIGFSVEEVIVANKLITFKLEEGANHDSQ